MRTVVLIAVALCVLQAAAAADALCVLKQFSGQVRVSEAGGKAANAARGPLYDGQTLVLDKGAEVTLVIGKRSVSLPGPLELPITADVLAAAQGDDDAGLLERLASLLPGLSDGGAYTSGAVRGEGDEGVPFRLFGPKGTLLSGDLIFVPLGDPSRCTLQLSEQGTPLLALNLHTAEPFTLQGLAPGEYEYQYTTADPLTQGGWPPVKFTVLDPLDARRPTQAVIWLSSDSESALQRASALAEAGFTYEAWRVCHTALTEQPDSPAAPLLRSLRDRLGGSLLEQ